MKSIRQIAMILFCSVLTTHSFGSSNDRFEQPISVIKSTLEKSTSAKGNIQQSCYIYKDFVIIEVIDPGLMGDERLVIRPSKGAGKDICNLDSKIKGYSINHNGYFIGKFKDYIYTEGPDSFGAYTPFQIFEISLSGYHLALEGNKGTKEKIKFLQNKNDIVGIDYWMGLSLANGRSCSLISRDKENCWRQLLVDNKFQTNIPLSKCPTTTSHGEISKDASTQVLLHVQVSNLKNPDKKKIIDNKAKCYYEP